jgi:hypothetical protein
VLPVVASFSIVSVVERLAWTIRRKDKHVNMLKKEQGSVLSGKNEVLVKLLKKERGIVAGCCKKERKASKLLEEDKKMVDYRAEIVSQSDCVTKGKGIEVVKNYVVVCGGRMFVWRKMMQWNMGKGLKRCFQEIGSWYKGKVVNTEVVDDKQIVSICGD